MSITKLKPVAGWAGPTSDPTLVGLHVRAPSKAPRILIGLLTGGDEPVAVPEGKRS